MPPFSLLNKLSSPTVASEIININNIILANLHDMRSIIMEKMILDEMFVHLVMCHEWAVRDIMRISLSNFSNLLM